MPNLIINERIAIGFTELRMQCSVGILPHEKEKTQEIIVSLKVELENKSFEEDRLQETVDYRDLAQTCKEEALSCHHHLLETLAEKMMQKIFLKFPVKAVFLKIEKPTAMQEARYCFVEMEKGTWDGR